MTDSGTFGDSVYESGDPVGDTDDLDPIAALTGDDPDEEQQTGYSPPEREPWNLRHPIDEATGESIDERLAEEEPDFGAQELSFTDVEPRAGRLVAPGEDAEGPGGVDDAEAAIDVGPGGYAASAEEAAVHIEPER
ncbi:MAG: hypothetical protein JO147_02940 [Actinobacteria bacterium]|nr:hypothetical protein [Actinomycetota bacterium]